MKVAISVIGRFHAFNMAQQLLKRDALGQLITTYPGFLLDRWGIPRKLASTFPAHEAMTRAWRRLPGWARRSWDPHDFFHRLHDRFARRHLWPGSDLLVGWSGMSLETIRRARRMGMVSVVERGSSHILHQQQVLAEECERFGQPSGQIHPRVIETELAEYEEADYIGIPSLYVKRTFLARGIPESKLIHVPYGAELAQFYPEPRSDSVFRVVHCGGLSLRKGVHYLLEAFWRLNLPGAELWLIGTVADEIRPFLEKFASPRIKVMGHKPQAELRHYYSQASVFCLASIEEGLAMVQPQAMACGLPLICTTNTGGDDLIRDGEEGFVIPIRDVPALEEKIRWCYEHPEQTRAMGESARRRLEAGFTWDDYGRRLCQAYATAVAKKHAGAEGPAGVA